MRAESMIPTLEGLVRLQQVESELRRVHSELAQIPQRKTALAADLAAERQRLDTVREALDTCQKSRRRHEGELQDLEAKRSRYKGQLMDVKTNKEYTAMLHEIEAVERDIRGREDQVLAEMEAAEALTVELRQQEGVFKAAEQVYQAETRRLDTEAATLEQQARALKSDRDEVAATIPEDARELFERVARLRGIAVAAARDGMCQVCHLKLRLQMYSDLKRNDEIMQCPACNRILYYDPPTPVVVAEP
jgi:uncharacterized protein